jgi:predicted transcriptional regulator
MPDQQLKMDVLRSIRVIITEYPDAPFSTKMIADTCKADSRQVEKIFEQLHVEGLIKRKFNFLRYTYSLTPAGVEVLKTLGDTTT